MDYTFEWDEVKNKVNYQKHGISFEEASTVFNDENMVLLPDDEHSDGEQRFLAIGYSGGNLYTPKLLLVCHCYRVEETIIRIISTRRPTRQERKNYEGRGKLRLKDNYDNLDFSKAISFKEKFPNFNTKKYSALVHFDLTDKPQDDKNAEAIQDGIERIRMEIYEHMRDLPPDQLDDALNRVFEAVKRELNAIPV